MLDVRKQIEALIGPEGAAFRVHPGWETRPQQLAMAEAVFSALTGPARCTTIEAPTGVGKTIAYLVPALLSGKRVIVSTNTKALQEQIIRKDLPLVSSILQEAGLDIIESDPLASDLSPNPSIRRFALMKGRSNYLCLERLERKSRRSQLPLISSQNELLRLVDWSVQTGRGDKSELEWLRDDSVTWSEVDARSDICIGRDCARYDDCFVTRMRRQAAIADLIVVNHHLLMADLSMRASMSLAGYSNFGEIIPQCDAIVIDEAHALEDIASSYFGGEVSSKKLERLVSDVTKWLDGIASPQDFLNLLTIIERTASDFFAMFPASDGRTKFQSDSLRERAKLKLDPLVDHLRLLSSEMMPRCEGVDPFGESLCRRAEEIAGSLSFVLESPSDDYVYWWESMNRLVKLGASPINVSSLLAEHLFDEHETVVLTSATLATKSSDGFSYFLERIGAPEETEASQLDTPFDFMKQAALFIPAEFPGPDETTYQDEFEKVVLDLIEMIDGGALLLFTSKRMMNLMHERLRQKLNCLVLLQGESPKSTLIARFKREAPAVLFATASFWEGIDIPGSALKLVVIDRLPFASPGDPLIAARCEELDKQGKSSFAKYQVPQAILRLKQGFGRLIRTSTDTGVVAVLDSRIRSRSYGQRFLKALPKTQRVSDIGHLKHWLEEITATQTSE